MTNCDRIDGRRELTVFPALHTEIPSASSRAFLNER